jgi:integrase
MTQRGPYKTKPIPGSFADLIMKFRQSPRYRAWAPSTRLVKDRILDNFRLANGKTMVEDMRRGDVIAMRDSMADMPEAANNWLKTIRVLLDYAVDLEMVTLNVARARVARLSSPNPDGFRTWREDEIAAYLAHWPLGSLPHTVLTLALYTGAARVDLVRLGWQNVEGDIGIPISGRIRYRRQKVKGGPWIDILILPPLAKVLALIPDRQMTFLETRDGRVRSDKGLTGDMGRWVKAAGLGASDEHGKGLTLHGLRKALGRRLAEAGVAPHGIMAILGHEDIKQAQTYTKAYDRARSADDAMERMGAIWAAPTKVTKLRRKE